MPRKLLFSLATLLASITFMLVPGTALAVPHWYENGVLVAEAKPLPVLSWGTIKVINEETLGEFECRAVSGGIVENPRGAREGNGLISALDIYECVIPECELSGGQLQRLAAEQPDEVPWDTNIIASEGLFREQIESVTLKLECREKPKGAELFSTTFTGKLSPKYLNGSAIGSKPSTLEFDSGSGELENVEFGPAKIRGKLKTMGYTGQEIVAIRNP